MTDVTNLPASHRLTLDCNANVPSPSQLVEMKTSSDHGSSDSLLSGSPRCNGEGDHVSRSSNWLTELAIIATSPQSPLMESRGLKGGQLGRQRQRHHSEGSVRHKQKSASRLSAAISSLNRAIHSYAKPAPRSPSPPPLITATSSKKQNPEEDDFIDPVGLWTPEGDSPISSCSSFPASVKETVSAKGTWSEQSPVAVWKCFLKGTKVSFASGCGTDWQLAEKIGTTEQKSAEASTLDQSRLPGSCQTTGASYAPLGLRLVKIEDTKPKDNLSELNESNGQAGDQVKLTFDPDVEGQPRLEAVCSTDHPFFVQDKGWSSYIPCQTVLRYGLPCSELDTGDVCLSSSHPDAIIFKESHVLQSFKSYDFTPLDSSAVLALSSMARHRRDLELSPTRNEPCSPSHDIDSCYIIPPGASASAPSSPVKGIKKLNLEEGNKGKRPMNAFMLFAKKFRLEYTQLHPDKDNRAISVLLGNRWKKMKQEERKVFSQEAKQLADEHKKIHPNCWKRKRSHSTSSMHHS